MYACKLEVTVAFKTELGYRRFYHRLKMTIAKSRPLDWQLVTSNIVEERPKRKRRQ